MIEIENTHGGGHNEPKKIIVHAIAEFLDGMYAPYFIEKIGLSAHAYITPSGVVIYSRAESQVAYHAKGHNQDTLGVELLVGGEHDYGSFLEAIKTKYITSKQYRALLILVRDDWMKEYQITSDKVHRHSDIDPDRKKDPGSGFPWEDFKSDLN